MKKFLILALAATSMTAFADIPAPPSVVSNAERMSITGEDAGELAESLSEPYQVLVGDRAGSTQAKVFYSSTGLTQIVCIKSAQRMGPHLPAQIEKNECVIEKSNNGRPLRRRTFGPPRIG